MWMTVLCRWRMHLSTPGHVPLPAHGQSSTGQNKSTLESEEAKGILLAHTKCRATANRVR